MTSLSTLLSSLSKSSSGWGTGGASGWGSGSTSTWGGRSSSYVKIPKVGKKVSASQSVANKIMAGSKAKGSKSNESVLGSILGGVADVAGNITKDVIATAENVPTGLYKIATTNPEDTIKAIGADYKTRYGKLFSGDFGGFAHQLEQHPLSYVLDAATVATGGAGVLAKAGVLSKDLETVGVAADRAAVKAGEGSSKSLDFFSGKGYKKVDINVSRNPATRQLQKGVYGLQAKLPASLPIIGEEATAKRALASNFQLESHGLDAGATKLLRDKYRKQYGAAADEAITKFHHVVGTGGLLGKSTQVWKDFTLAARPGFQTTNVVGNTAMFHGANGLFSASKGLTLAKKGDLNKPYERYFGGASDTYGGTEAGAGKGVIRRGVNKSYNLQGTHETWLRKGTMYSAAMKIPEIKTLVRQGEGKGLSTGEALSDAMDTAFKGEHGMALRREVAGKMKDTMGDYSHYSAAEQRLKQIVPFYGWNRHASRYLYATSRDKPGQILAMNQIAKQGETFHDNQGFAGTPEFMTGYLNTLGHTFDTSTLNPLKGGTDVLKSVKDLVTGHASASAGDLGSNLNPFIANTAQALSGTSLLTGAPIKKNNYGLLGSVLEQTVRGLPQFRLAAGELPSGVLNQIPGHAADTSNPHYYLTATGRLQKKFENPDTGAIKLDDKGMPVLASGRHMQEPNRQSLIASFLGIPDRGKINQKVAKEVEKSVQTKNNPGTFHPAKKRKKKPSFKSVTQPTVKAGGWGATTSSWGG